VNVRTTDGFFPLLRRPFSISRVEGDNIELLFSIVGEGTRLLASKRPGDQLDVLGPLGNPFNVVGNYETALIVAGGLGVAPFPFLTDRLQREEKHIVSFVGARTAYQLYTKHLKNVHVATDDGSSGFQGTVVTLMERFLDGHDVSKPKIFACGPTPMMKALAVVAIRRGIECELSLEGEMACGIGICQGCPVERANGENKKYALVCTEGPAFNSKEILLH
jgi:dihydroorotate dehydrogenase electron transfer subunit